MPESQDNGQEILYWHWDVPVTVNKGWVIIWRHYSENAPEDLPDFLGQGIVSVQMKKGQHTTSQAFPFLFIIEAECIDEAVGKFQHIASLKAEKARETIMGYLTQQQIMVPGRGNAIKIPHEIIV
jgi:hypothetical protein|tara:strand:+ start:312 stop:686 length:375 start_codon:yes stop_codon:yes gene_type:complete